MEPPALVAADFCCGLRAPLSFALAWCGWTVEAFDIEFGVDLVGEQHDQLWQRRAEFLVRMWAMPCSTFSRAREKQFASSSDGGPPPLRSLEFTKGLPGLSPSQQQRVDTDTQLAVHATQWALDSLGAEQPAPTLTLMENPRRSLLWQLGEYKAVAAHADWFEAAYDACCFLGARRKAQTVAANSGLIVKLQSKCHHLHDGDEWRRSDKFATAEEKEYTAHFAFALAIVISLWAVTHRGVKMFVPRPLAPLSSGSRQGWCKLDAAATRQQAMIPMGLRLGLLPPRSSPGPWYPETAMSDL